MLARKNGFTLIELMIAMMLGIIVVGGAMSMYISTIRTSADIVKSARLNYDLDTTMQLMVNDLRRAGYWGGAIISGSNDFLLENPFSDTNTTVNIRTVAAPTTDPTPNSGDCILYSYDADGNGKDEDLSNPGNDKDGNAITVIASTEYYGFKLEDNAIKIRYSGSNTTDCDNGLWERITDEDTIKITHLEFNFLPIAAQTASTGVHPALPALTASSRCLNSSLAATHADYISNSINCTNAVTDNILGQRRVINIHLSGYVKDDVTLKSLSMSVHIRNDRLYTVP